MHSWGTLQTKATKWPQINCHFWGDRDKSKILCTLTSKGVGHPSTHQSALPSPVYGTILLSLEVELGAWYLFSFSPSCCSMSPNKALPEFLIWSHQFLLIKEPKDPGHYYIGGQYSNSMAATPYLPQFLITWPLHKNVAADFHQSKHTMRTSVMGARVIL